MNLKQTTCNPIGSTIRTERTKANLTLSELEGLSGVAKGVISKLENGEIKHPDFQTVHDLCRALQMSYTAIVDLYIAVETKAELLLPVLHQAASEEPSLCEKIAKRILGEDREDSYEFVDELFSFITTITDRTVQLSLYKLIISHTRLLGMQTHHAKALYQAYLIERDNFRNLRHTYDAGKSIVDYAGFLTQEDRDIFYYKLGGHAYHLTKYEEAITYFEKAEKLDAKNAELKAWTYLLSSSSYYRTGQFDIAFAYLKLVETYPFPFVKESIQFMTGALNIKIDNTDIGVQQLQNCVKNTSYKINAVNILLDIYLKEKEWDAIKKLISQENEFLNSPAKNPKDAEEQAIYYENTSKYYRLQKCTNMHIEYLFKSLAIYAKIDMNEKMMDCLGIIFENIWTEEQQQKINILFKEFRQQYNIEVFK